MVLTDVALDVDILYLGLQLLPLGRKDIVPELESGFVVEVSQELCTDEVLVADDGQVA